MKSSNPPVSWASCPRSTNCRRKAVRTLSLRGAQRRSNLIPRTRLVRYTPSLTPAFSGGAPGDGAAGDMPPRAADPSIFAIRHSTFTEPPHD